MGSFSGNSAETQKLKRFGFVTTNSISQVFQRRVMEAHLNAKKPLSLTMAIPDHPWTKVTRDSAAVRIAMTVAQAGKHEGRLMEVVSEEAVETDSPVILFAEKQGKINSDLTVGADVTGAKELKANASISSPGVKLHGAGFIVSPEEAVHLGLGKLPDLERYIRIYRNGRDLMDRPRGVMVIDMFGLGSDEIRSRFPAIYQHLHMTVKAPRDKQVADAENPTKDAISYAENWWLFGKPRSELRPALARLPRYIATVETAKHRVFQFLDASILPDNMVIAFALTDAHSLGVLSSQTHRTWVAYNAASMGVYIGDVRYSKSRCFDPFPFPDATEIQKASIGAIAEELDAHRKRVLEEHPHLTLTGLYNVLERLKAGARPDELNEKERRIFDDGLVLIIKELHERLDAAVADAYGWPVDLAEEEVLARLVALNKERAKEEKRGLVRWLRPDYQIPRFGSEKEKAEQIEADFGEAAVAKAGPKPSFPTDERDQTPAVLHQLMEAEGPIDAAAIASSFKQGRKCLGAVQAVLNALSRMGLVSTADGKRFAWRRVA